MDKVKVIFTSVWSVFLSILGVLAIPVLLLVACNIIDYSTGVIAAKYRNQAVSSYKGIRGIAKKICMWLLVVVGAIIDKLLIYSSGTVGVTLPFSFLVACVVAIWLVCNELISILENISDIGVALPPFLEKIVKNLKSQVEIKATVLDTENVKPEVTTETEVK